MAQKQTVADRIMGETSMMTRMASAEASDARLCPRCSGFMVQERFEDFPGGVRRPAFPRSPMCQLRGDS